MRKRALCLFFWVLLAVAPASAQREQGPPLVASLRALVADSGLSEEVGVARVALEDFKQS